jgi:predicted DCC family thiol-disulfide oxidoreductase YuxK
MKARPLYSYRADPQVPDFADERPLIVFDGACVLCSAFVGWVVRRDRHRRFRFLPAQSPLGEALFRHYGFKGEDYETNLLIADGRLHGKSDGFMEVARRLDGAWPLLAIGRVAPRPARDWLYDRIARNRYRLFGRRTVCFMPPSDAADRFLG